MAAADYRLMTEATGQRIATALENLAGFGSYLTTADVVNNLTRDATKVPSAQCVYDATMPFIDTNKSWTNVDADTLVTSGFYAISTSAHVPFSWGILIVIAIRSDTVRQIYLGGDGGIYARGYQSGAWGNWKNSNA